MSRRRIKIKKKKVAPAEQEFKLSMKTAALSHLHTVRAERKEKDTGLVLDLIKNKNFDVTRRGERKYMEPIARSLNWNVRKLETVAAHVATNIKNITTIAKKTEEIQNAENEEDQDHD